MSATITEAHRQKPAYVYVRQSTMGQVRHHQESTERQYALKDKALALGWPARQIRILDQDLGLSGAQASGREDFKTLVAEVSMGVRQGQSLRSRPRGWHAPISTGIVCWSSVR